jgi:ABC-2 type transport system permease protein
VTVTGEHTRVGADAPAPTPRPHVRGRLLTPRIVAATAHRVLLQLRSDRRTVGMLLVVPSVLLALIQQMFDSQPDFNRVALVLIGIFPFTTMFLVTSIAMLRERTGGTLERLLTTPLAKLDLLLGYGIAFAVAAALQATSTCLVAYLLLDLYTPGSPLLVFASAVASAVLGMSIGLLASAFATTEFQAVQFMPIVVLPQTFLGGLFVPREQMAGWLESVSDALPLTYSIEAMQEVGSTSLLTTTFLVDSAVVVGSALLALVLGATTLRRTTGDLDPARRRRRLAVPVVVLAVAGGFALAGAVDASRYVSTDEATVEGEQIPIVAPAAGTLLTWEATRGSTVRANEPIGRIELSGGAVRPRKVLRAPAAGTVVADAGVEGAFVAAGTRLAVLYDLSAIYVTARVDETDLRDVRVGSAVQIVADAAPGRTLTGWVREIPTGTADVLAGTPREDTTGVYDRRTRTVPVRVALAAHPDVLLVPGMNVTVRIPRD